MSEKIVHNQAEIKSLTSLIIQKEKVIAAVEKQMAALEVIFSKLNFEILKF